MDATLLEISSWVLGLYLLFGFLNNVKFKVKDIISSWINIAVSAILLALSIPFHHTYSLILYSAMMIVSIVILIREIKGSRK